MQVERQGQVVGGGGVLLALLGLATSQGAAVVIGVVVAVVGLVMWAAGMARSD